MMDRFLQSGDNEELTDGVCQLQVANDHFGLMNDLIIRRAILLEEWLKTLESDRLRMAAVGASMPGEKQADPSSSDEFAEEDFRVGVEGMDDQLEQLVYFGLELLF